MTGPATPLRQLRHDLRGKANTLMLCTAALPLADSADERLEFVNEIIRAADTLLGILDQLEAMPEHFEENGISSS
jgi:hypothetical protein